MQDRRSLVMLSLLMLALPAWVSPAFGQVEFPNVQAAKPGAPAAAGLPAALDEQLVGVQASFTQPAADGSAELSITATIQSGWHIYSITQAPGGPLAAKIALDPSNEYQIGKFQATPPPSTKIEPLFDNLKVESHTGTVTWRAPLRLASGVDPAKLNIRGMLRVQVCQGEERCEQKEIPIAATLSQASTVVAVASPEATSTLDLHELAKKLGFAFLGGLILNLMPCVLPVISLKILSFLEQAGESRSRIFALNVWYSLGLMSVFMVLAALAATSNQAWGEQFTLPWFKVALTALVFAMSLSFLGVWEIPIPGFVGRGQANQLQAQEGASGAFFKGVFATVLATPCSGPFLAPVFGYLLTQPPLVIYCFFGAVGFGMASPYLVIGAFPGLIRLLPRPGAWMETFKQLMAFFLLGTVVYLFSTLTTVYFLPTLMFLIAIGCGVWLIGHTPITANSAAKTTAWGTAILMSASVGILAFKVLLPHYLLTSQPYSSLATAYFIPVLALAVSIWFGVWLIGRMPSATGLEVKIMTWGTAILTVLLVGAFSFTVLMRVPKLDWQPYSPEAVAQARQEGKTVMVDFSANWCPTCKSNLATAVDTEQVHKLVEKNGVVTLLADWTDQSPMIKQSLNDLGFNSIPLLVIWPGSRPNEKPKILSDLIFESQVLDALTNAGPSRSAGPN